MSFADLRRQALIDCSLSLEFGAENVIIEHRGEKKQCRVNVQQYVATDPRPLGPEETTQDEKERIRVVFNRDEAWVYGGIATKPNIGEALERAEGNDADVRSFTFSGEVEREDKFSATYIYERPRRFSQGRRL